MSYDEYRTYALVRGGAQAGVPMPVQQNSKYELLTAQGLPPYVEMSRLGNGWQVMDTSATAAVVVRPSTTAGLTLYNGESVASGKVYVLDAVMAFNLVSTDAVAAWSIWGCLHPSMTAPTADITAIKSLNGKSTYSGNAIVDTGATVTDHGWFPLTNTMTIGNPGGVTPGMAICQEVGGRFIIPPGGGFSINVVASVVGYTFTHGFRWYEVVLPNEI